MTPGRTPTVPVWLFSLGVAASVFSGHSGELGLPIGLDRLLILAAVMAMGLRVPLFGTGHRRTLTPRAFALAALLCVVVTAAVLSALWAGTLTDHEPQFALLDRLGIVPFLAFMLAPRLFRTDRERDVLLVVLVGLGLYLGLTAVLEGIGADALVFPRYITDPHLGLHAERARGPFLEAVPNGFALFACAVVGVLAAARWRGIPRALALVAVVLCAVGIVFTLTRSVWLAAVLGSLAALAMHGRTRRWIVPGAAVGAVLVVGLLAIVPGLAGSTSDRANDQRPVWDRLNSNAAALRMVDERPLAGFGWYRFLEASPTYYRQSDAYPLTGVGVYVHNAFLSNAVELGVPVTLLWIAALVAALAAALSGRASPAEAPWRLALVAIAVSWLVVANFTPMGYAFPHLLLWTWAGVVWARVQGRSAPLRLATA